MGAHVDVDVFEAADRTFWCEVDGKVFEGGTPFELDAAMGPDWLEGRRVLHYRGLRLLPVGDSVE